MLLAFATQANSGEDSIKMAVERVGEEYDTELEVEHHAKRFVEIAMLEREALKETP